MINRIFLNYFSEKISSFRVRYKSGIWRRQIHFHFTDPVWVKHNGFSIHKIYPIPNVVLILANTQTNTMVLFLVGKKNVVSKKTAKKICCFSIKNKFDIAEYSINFHKKVVYKCKTNFNSIHIDVLEHII